MSARAAWRAIGWVGVAAVLSCSSAGGGGENLTPQTGGSGGSAGNQGDASVLPDGNFLDASQQDGQVNAKTVLKGKVVAPEGTIPISGALVYVTASNPAAIPAAVYCDKCVKLGAETPYTTTKADGTFELPTWKTGNVKLVVQKGQFRRVRSLEVIEEGEQDVPLELTTLPGRMDKANGDDIPKMAIVPGAWDRIDVSLAKLGLAKITGKTALGGIKVDYATAGFDYYQPDNPLNFSDPKQPSVFLKDQQALDGYNIIFFPCDGNTGEQEWCTGSLATTGEVRDNLRSWVAKGGKLYVTDFSYEFVRQLFPDYISWQGETDTIGSACQHGSWDAPADVKDQGLQDWLTAMSLSNWNVEANWTTITGVHPVATEDMDGNPVTVTPKVWVEGMGPSTVSFERSCGRVLFSTYHTEADKGSETELLPQEKALLYILLEVAVCVAPPNVY